MTSEAEKLLEAVRTRESADKEKTAAAVRERTETERRKAEFAARRVLNDLTENVLIGNPLDRHPLVTMTKVEKESGSEKFRLLLALEELLEVELQSRLVETSIPEEDLTPWDNGRYYYTLSLTNKEILSLLGEKAS